MFNPFDKKVMSRFLKINESIVCPKCGYIYPIGTPVCPICGAN